MQTTIDNEQWKNFLDFLSPTIDQDKLEEKLQSTKIGSAAQWLLDSEEFQRWSEGVQWQLRCYGERGTGKVRSVHGKYQFNKIWSVVKSDRTYLDLSLRYYRKALT